MKETTITFTNKATMAKGIYLVKDGLTIIAKSVINVVDKTIHTYPYLFICSAIILQLLITIPFIIELRQERDAAWHEQYILKKENEQLRILEGINNE